MTKKKKKFDFLDPRFKWLLSSADVEVEDGLFINIENDARIRFMNEANPDGLDIEDHVRDLRKEVAHWKKQESLAQEKIIELTNMLRREVRKKWWQKLLFRD